ncbi:MAG: DUF4224 domain-containing protein [Pandoraea sp.]|nr:DUF4224 domain-containing protein [Pandoraea sp.]
MSPYLSREEVRELTGTPIRKRQVRWLLASRWPHEIDSRGRVLIARAYHDKRLGIASGHIPPDARPTPPPLNLHAA